MDRAALDPERLAPDQGLGHLPACRLEDPSDRGPGDAHPLGGLLLVEPLEVGEAEGFEFVEGQHQLLEEPGVPSPGLEEGGGRGSIHAAAAGRAGHAGIMNICS